MEKTLSQEERIKRAEEIYYQRRFNNNDIRMPSMYVKEKSEKRKFSLYRKLAIQILTCILIYLIFSLVKEANYLFSEDVINNTKNFLNQDINFEEIYTNVTEFWENNKSKLNIFVHNQEQDIINTQTNEVNAENLNANEQSSNNVEIENSNEQISNNIDAENNEKNSNDNQTTGIGGASNIETEVADKSADKTQMEIDAEYIKTNFEMQLPVKATVTSEYGTREETEIVSAEHYGIDLGVVEGTTIVAAMAGTVTVVSDEGEYGTHVKIVNNDVTTIYAHCSKILVQQGKQVKIGQKIALSGNTGKTTGPHLHFEIRRENRTVDPALILNF